MTLSLGHRMFRKDIAHSAESLFIQRVNHGTEFNFYYSSFFADLGRKPNHWKEASVSEEQNNNNILSRLHKVKRYMKYRKI